MSGLIDRQAAIKVASVGCEELRGAFARIEEGLNKLPTTEAIPVKWLLKWNEENDNDYVYNYLLRNKIIPKMIEDWRRENETEI